MIASRVVPGVYNRRLKFYNPPSVANEAGELTTAGTLYATVSGRLVKSQPEGDIIATGAEAGRPVSTMIEIFEVRWNSGLNAKMSMVDGGQTYRITDITAKDGNPRDGLLVRCRKVQ